MKNILNRFRFDRIMVISLWPHFLAHPVLFQERLREAMWQEGGISLRPSSTRRSYRRTVE